MWPCVRWQQQGSADAWSPGAVLQDQGRPPHDNAVLLPQQRIQCARSRCRCDSLRSDWASHGGEQGWWWWGRRCSDGQPNPPGPQHRRQGPPRAALTQPQRHERRSPRPGTCQHHGAGRKEHQLRRSRPPACRVDCCRTLAGPQWCRAQCGARRPGVIGGGAPWVRALRESSRRPQCRHGQPDSGGERQERRWQG